MKLLFISSLLVAATNAADVDRRRINGITFADQAVEALNLVHKGQASQASSSTVLIKKGESDNKGGDDKSSRDDKSSNDKSSNKSSNSKSSSSKSSGSSRSSSRDGRGVCGEKKDYCENYDSSSFLNIKKEDGGNKGGDDKNKSSRDDKSSNDKSSGSSKSKSSSSSTSSRDGDRRTDRCFRACDTDRCTSDDRRRLACPDSTAASSDMKFVQKGQASPIQKQKLVWAAKGESDNKGGDGKSSRDDKSSDKSSNSKSSSSNSSGSSRDGRGVCGESDDYCKNYDSSSFLNIKKEDGGNKGGDNKSSGSSKSKSSSSSTNSRDGGRRSDRCFRACDTDRCTSADRRRLACPDSTAASSDMKFVQKGQASPSVVWAAKKDDEGGDDPASNTSPDNSDSPDDKSDDKSDDKDKSSSSTTKSSSGTGPSGDNDRTWSGSDICKAPKNWCGGSSADGDDKCDDACDKDSGCDKEQRKHLGCDATSNDVAATKKLRRRKA